MANSIIYNERKTEVREVRMKHGLAWKNGIIAVLLAAAAGLAALFGVLCGKSAAAAGSEWKTMRIQAGHAYTIRSDGGDFYFAFGRYNNRQDGELARLLYAIKEIDYEISAEASLYAFTETPENVAAGAVGAGSGMLVEEADSGSLASVPFLTSTYTAYGLLPYKDPAGETVNFLARTGINDYTQKTFGEEFEDKGMYGLYFRGVTLQTTVLVLGCMAGEAAFYYGEGVTVTDTAPGIDAEVELQNAEEVQPDELLAGTILNGELSFIPFTPAVSQNENEVYTFENIEVNGAATENYVLQSDGADTYLYIELAGGDTVSVNYGKQSVTFGEPAVYDLIDVAEKKEISFDEIADSELVVGNIPNTADTAFRFRFQTPVLPSGKGWDASLIVKFSVFNSNVSFWSNFGFIVSFWQDTVRILTGEEVELAKTTTAADVKPNTTIGVEIGIKKGYDEAGVYKFDRVYVKVNDSQVVYYDDYVRNPLGSGIVGPYLDQTFADVAAGERCVISNWDPVWEILSAPVEGVTQGGDKFVQPGESARIVFTELPGYELVSVRFGGQDVTGDLTGDGNVKTLITPAVTADTSLEYTVAAETVGVTFEAPVPALEESSVPGEVPYGSGASLSFTLKTGYTVKKVTANGEDVTESVKIENGVFTLGLGALVQDTAVVVECEEKSFTLTAGEAEGASVNIVTPSVKAGGSGSFTVSPAEGRKLVAVYVDGRAVTAENGVYIVENMYADAVVTAETVAYTPEENTASQPEEDETGCNSAVFAGMPLLAAAAAGVAALLCRHKRNKR